ncbi:MAG: UDP-N-acetylmuramoyl-tripeptide--D-alanyl-D-alanine ligase [Solirubrobacterales bacterium]
MTALGWIALSLAGLAILVLFAGRAHLLLHLLQLEHYEFKRLRVWVRRRGERFNVLDVCLSAGIGCLIVAAFTLNLPGAATAIGAIGLAAAIARAQAVVRRPQVKPLKFTARASRLFATSLALAAIAIAGALIVGGLTQPRLGGLAMAVAGFLLAVFAPEFLGIANWLLRPIQRVDNARFEHKARRRLREIDPMVIGITGSYGKTTTKACVAEIASLIGPALPTPASYNSYLGVIRAINENLRPSHRSFIVEMGAYRRGDIAELCRLVEPRIGILTSIGLAHLERFGSLDETTRAKGELAEALPSDGVFITRADQPRCLEAAERASCPVRLFAGEQHPDALAWADNIRLHRGRTRFDLCLREAAGITRQPVSARLLGQHNVANLVAAAVVGLGLGLAPDQIARALGRVSPPEHRLAPIVNRAAGIVVIDDAYNANPSGAQAALEVLAAHPGHRRILVTPGMVELGDQQDAENERFGAAAAGICDLIILVGEEQTEPIRRGLESAGFSPDSLCVVADASAAGRLLAEKSRSGDVILFENDLPDLYQGRARRQHGTAIAAA